MSRIAALENFMEASQYPSLPGGHSSWKGSATIATTHKNAKAIEQFLASKLHEDYLHTPYRPWREDPIFCFARICITIGLDAIYEKAIGRVVMVMGLNKSHVEEKVHATIKRDANPEGNDIKDIIKQRDWKKLAGMLYGDRELVDKVGVAADRPKIYGAIKTIEDRYFTTLPSPATYTLSIHARNLDSVARQIQGSPPEYVESPPYEERLQDDREAAHKGDKRGRHGTVTRRRRRTSTMFGLEFKRAFRPRFGSESFSSMGQAFHN